MTEKKKEKDSVSALETAFFAANLLVDLRPLLNKITSEEYEMNPLSTFNPTIAMTDAIMYALDLHSAETRWMLSGLIEYNEDLIYESMGIRLFHEVYERNPSTSENAYKFSDFGDFDEVFGRYEEAGRKATRFLEKKVKDAKDHFHQTILDDLARVNKAVDELDHDELARAVKQLDDDLIYLGYYDNI